MSTSRKLSPNASPKDSSDGSLNASPTTPTNGIAPMQSAIVNPDIPQYSDSIKEAWRLVNAETPQAKGVEKLCNSFATVQDALTPSDGRQAVVTTLATPLQINTPQIVAEIEESINTFKEAVPVIFKGLDEVAKIHPFIQAAVVTFKAVYTLEMTRRDNDKKVTALFLEMRNMMTVLINLKRVSDPKEIAPDGQTIEGRMQGLCADVVDDIKRCATACDAYRKKKLIVKILAGPIWEGRLMEFVETFAKRRQEFEFALTIHATVGVDEANLKLDGIGDRMGGLDQKIEALREVFQKFITPEQRQLVVLVESKGGKAVIENNQAMKELWETEASFSTRTGGKKDESPKERDLRDIRHEIREDPDGAIERNVESFTLKLDLQIRQMQEEITLAVHRQGDRVISAVTGGPHNRIQDPDLYEIWKEMRWRGSVKARHFVLSLRDHFAEKVIGGDSEGGANTDHWAMRHIGVNSVRSILEAFDDDASGFVTVKEANIFTNSRPRDWSLLHWLGYWAIGWQITSTNYCERIEEIFDAMIRLSEEALPVNRKEVNAYIEAVWKEAVIFVTSLRREGGTGDLRAKFQTYVIAEEERLRKNLEGIKYDIDSYDDVRLISGHGRVELTLLPTLYLILKRDLQKIILAREHILADCELSDATKTVQYIAKAAMYRVSDLRTIFEQQNLPPREQFAIFAKGLFNIASEGKNFHGDKLRELPDPIPARDEIIPDSNLDPLTVLKYPTGSGGLDTAAYDDPFPPFSPTDDSPDAVLGTYFGFIYKEEIPIGPMVEWKLNRGDGPNSITASGTYYAWGYRQSYTLTGTTGSLEGGKMRMDLKINCAWIFSVNMTGYFDIEENSIRGTTTEPDGTQGEFVFKRDWDLIRLYPAPSTIDARRRWEFVRTAVLGPIRRRSRSHVLERREERRRYTDLGIRIGYYGKALSSGEWAEYGDLISKLSARDVRFYASCIIKELSEVPIHPIFCDSCGITLGGPRILCMDCHDDTTTVDFCSEPECFDSPTIPRFAHEKRLGAKALHTPTHNVLKVHRILFNRDTGRVERRAKYALEVALETLRCLEAKGEPMPKCFCCQTEISLPCWYCVDCADGFICTGCEHDGLAFNEIHTKQHVLVRVIQEVAELGVSTEEQLKGIREQLEYLQGELSRMRQLLLEKGMGGSPGDPPPNGRILDPATAGPNLEGHPLEVGNNQSDEHQISPAEGEVDKGTGGQEGPVGEESVGGERD